LFYEFHGVLLLYKQPWLFFSVSRAMNGNTLSFVKIWAITKRWSPKIGQCVKVDSRNLLKEDYHHEQYQTQTFFRRV